MKRNCQFLKKSNWYIFYLNFLLTKKIKIQLNQINEIVNLGIEKKFIIDAVFANSKKQSKEIWNIRENISEAQRKDGASIKNDISVPIFAVDEFIKKQTL